MGIIKIFEYMYEWLCLMSMVLSCLINVQVEYWLCVGMLVEFNLVLFYGDICKMLIEVEVWGGDVGLVEMVVYGIEQVV